MKIFLSLLLSCVSGLSVGMTFFKPFERAPGPDIIYDTFERSSLGSDWWNRGGATVSMYNSNMLVYQASAAIITNYVMFTNWYTAHENFEATWDQTPIATNATTAGVYFSMRAAAVSATRSVWAGVYLASDANVGRATIGKNDNSTFTTLATAPSGRAITGFGGVPIQCRVSVTNNTWHMFATNPANGSYTHTNYTFLLSESGNLNPVSSYFAFNILAGSNVIDNFRIRFNRRIPTYLVGLDKSIGSGSAATNANERFYTGLFTNANWPSYINAGGGDATTNWLRRIREILLYRPKYLWIGMPSDVIQGVASNIWSSNLTFLVETFRSNGLNVNVMAASPHNTASQIPHNLVVSNSVGFVNNVVYGGWTELRTNSSSAHPPFYHADLIHPNAVGHLIMKTSLVNRYLRP